MKPGMTDLFRKLQFPVLLAATFAPLSATIFAFLVPDKLLLGWLFPCAYLLLALPYSLIPQKVRRAYAVSVSLLFGFAGIFLVLRLSRHFLLLAISLLYGILLLLTLPTANYSRDEEPPKFLLWIGMVLHVTGYILLRYSRVKADIPQGLAIPPLLISFALFFLLAMLSRNRGALAAVAAEKTAIPLRMRRSNRLLLLGFAVAVLIISAIPAVATGLSRLLRWGVLLLLQLLLTDDTPANPRPTGPTEPTENSFFDALPSGKPNDLAVAMEPVLLVIFRILLAVGAVAVFITLIILSVRLLKKLLLWSVSFLSCEHTGSVVTEDYEDEITDTRETVKAGSSTSRSSKVSFFDERRLPPRERIRYRYRRLLKRHPQWQSSSTARENLPEVSAALYEKARYSEMDISSQNAEQFLSYTKNS